MNLRELLAFAISSGDLTHNPLIETGADRIGALAFADPLGAALWRILVDHDRHAWIAARELLRKRISNKRDSPEIYRRLCDTALCEWMLPGCKTCGGRRFKGAHGEAKVACTACDATGVGRHSDAERMRSMKLDKRAYQRFEAKFALAHQKLSEADGRAGTEVANQLERGYRKAA